MAFSNFMLTLMGVGAAILLLRGDVKQTASTLRKNVRQIRMWLEQEEAVAKRYIQPQKATALPRLVSWSQIAHEFFVTCILVQADRDDSAGGGSKGVIIAFPSTKSIRHFMIHSSELCRP